MRVESDSRSVSPRAARSSSPPRARATLTFSTSGVRERRSGTFGWMD
jgi:hypothetical protein